MATKRHIHSQDFDNESTTTFIEVSDKPGTDNTNVDAQTYPKKFKPGRSFSHLEGCKPDQARIFDELSPGVHNIQVSSAPNMFTLETLLNARTGISTITHLAQSTKEGKLGEGEVQQRFESKRERQDFILMLAKSLMKFGAPSHRIESQLQSASGLLQLDAAFVHIPNIIIVTFTDPNTQTVRTHFVRASGKVALTALRKVHFIYRDVLHQDCTVSDGTDALQRLLKAPPIYPLIFRCGLAFISSAVICVLSFGGSILDACVSGLCASLLQYLGLNVASKSATLANVYEISVSIMVSFLARAIASIPGQIFCYSSVSSAGVVSILPGFTVLIAALELTSKNILCGSVRIVYAIIYTLFLGFGLTIGSDFYLVLDARARRAFYQGPTPANLTWSHGSFLPMNGTYQLPINGTLSIGSSVTYQSQHVVSGCFRDPSWPWWRQPLPFWTIFFLVPIYTTCSSLANLQDYTSIQFPVMILFSCCSYAANKGAAMLLPGRTDIISAAGALVIGTLGNLYSRIVRGTAFTSMVTGVLFLVPSGIATGGGLTQQYSTSEQQYSSGFSLALRMIEVACGVTIGLFVSQLVVYAMGKQKNVALMAF